MIIVLPVKVKNDWMYNYTTVHANLYCLSAHWDPLIKRYKTDSNTNYNIASRAAQSNSVLHKHAQNPD